MPSLTTPLVATTDFAYIRFHGSARMYEGCYFDEEISDWAQRIAGLAQGVKAVYIYFNNDAGGFALRNALSLRQKLAEMAE